MKNENDFFNNLHDSTVGIDGSRLDKLEITSSGIPVSNRGIDGSIESPTFIERESEEKSSEIGEEISEKDSEIKEEKVIKTPKVEKTEEFSFSPLVNSWVEDGMFTEEDLEKADIDDSPEGLKKLITYSADKFKEEGKKEAINQLPEYVKELLKYHEEGVDIKQLKSIEENENDFAAIREGLQDDVETQRAIYYDYLTSSGMNAEKAEKMVQKAEDSDTLFDHAENATEQLEKLQNKQKESFIESQKAEFNSKQKQATERFEEFKKDILNTKEIKGFNLAPKEAAELLDYMTKPVDKSGKTQEQLDWDNAETRKLFALLNKRKFDFKSLEKKIETRKVIELKKKIENHSDKGLSSKGTGMGSSESNESKKRIAGLENLFGRM